MATGLSICFGILSAVAILAFIGWVQDLYHSDKQHRELYKKYSEKYWELKREMDERD